MREVLLFAVHCNSFVMPSRTFSGDEDLLISLLEPLPASIHIQDDGIVQTTYYTDYN